MSMCIGKCSLVDCELFCFNSFFAQQNHRVGSEGMSGGNQGGYETYAKHGQNATAENDRVLRRGLIHVMSRPWSRCVYVSTRSRPLVDSAETVGSFIYFFATWLNRHNSDRSRSCIAMTSPSGVQPGTRVSPLLSTETAVTLRPSAIAGW